MNAIFYLLLTAIEIYQFILICAVILSLLISFNVVNPYNQVVSVLNDILTRLTEPVLRPIRNILPNLGPVDISPMVLLILLGFLKVLIARDLMPALL